jgi:hypothetical protein
MALIEPHASWRTLEARAAGEPNPRRKALLLNVRDHMEHEIRGELEPLLATLIDEPVYHFRGNGPVMALEGGEALRTFYAGMIAAGSQQFEVVVERIVVDDDAVVTQGRVKQVFTGAQLLQMGATEAAGEPVAREGLYLTNAALVTVWPAAADGRLVGEDIYFGEDAIGTVRRIAVADLPEGYVLPRNS